jgi:DNA-binding transcriptional regulator YiaG
MLNFASAIKEEITRLARKEIKAHTTALKKSSAQYRSDIARLKKEATKLTSAINKLTKASGNAAKSTEAEDGTKKGRYSSKSLISQRKRLALSAADYGKLVGVTGHTIYAWEQGKSKPRQAQAKALAEGRGLGKKEAAQRLEGPAKK